jgi:hypothetical protein
VISRDELRLGRRIERHPDVEWLSNHIGEQDPGLLRHLLLFIRIVSHYEMLAELPGILPDQSACSSELSG